MVSDNIIVSQESFESSNKYELIYSNINSINQLYNANISDDRIYEDALKSYYIDSYLAQIIFAGFATFIKESSTRPKYLYYIREGLKAIKADKNICLLDEAFLSKDRSLAYFRGVDQKFERIQNHESIVNLHYKWLMNHPRLLHLEERELSQKLERLKYELSSTQKHRSIIKKLCQQANETYLRITAGDPNNPFQDAWYFKTTSGHYFMIEKEGIATMYNSLSKEKVTEVATKILKKRSHSLLKRSSI